MDLAIENALRKDFTPAERAQAIFTVLSTIDSVSNDQLRAYSLVTQVKLMNKRGAERITNKKGNSIGFNINDVYQCQRLLKLIGASENTCLKYLRFLDLPKTIADKIISISSNESLSKRMISQGYITVTMGYELSRIRRNSTRRHLYKKAVKERWNAITLRHIVDEILESGKEEQVNKLGSSKRRGEEDYGMDSLAKRCFNLSSALWNFRKKIPIIPLSLDKLIWRASLKKLKKSCAQLLKEINELLNDEKGIYKTVDIKNESIEVTIRPGVGGQRYRFGFPKKQGERLGLDPGDKMVLKIDSIKKETGKVA